MIQKERVQLLNQEGIRQGSYILYWMQASQRAELNHALEYSIRLANDTKKSVLVAFCLVDNFSEANISHYRFMLEGLQEVGAVFEKRGIGFALLRGNPDKIIPSLAEDAAQVVVDRDYQRDQIKWRSEVSKRLDCRFIQVESNVVVPVQTAAQKEQYSAGVFRPRISRRFDSFLVPLRMSKLKVPIAQDHMGEDLSNIEATLNSLKVKSNREQNIRLKGGTSNALKKLRFFIQNHLDGFAEQRNDPAQDRLSSMSPYLHFGQISPLQIALQTLEAGSPGEEPFLEELVVRRELSMNFCHFNEFYDTIKSLPPWARKTLDEHEGDTREYVYSYREFEMAKTHDPYWNAAQTEMIHFGNMHGYMRMYWGKKILEWSETPEVAYETCIKLNDRYELDGRDPNGYAGVAWCFGKHDRAWGERPVFGKIRYMNANGLRRKFEIDKYVARVSSET